MKFYIDTLGCKVNTYESNVMHDLLVNAGYHEGTKEDADIVVINTCTVTNTADRKSAKMVRQAKTKNPTAILVVVGCFPQVGLEKVKDLGADIILGNYGKSLLVSYIEQFLRDRQPIVDIRMLDRNFESMMLNNFEHTRAFVKIQDGCENFCSYCIIPYSRGPVRSRPKDDILKEIKHLVELGHLEIVLTGIHTGHYGSDFEDFTFADLLKEILQIEGLKRLRISSIEMNELTDEVLRLFQTHDILVDHLHIPLQSGSDAILKAMNRKYTKQQFIDKIEQIREIRPNISITTDCIVGFPQEDETLFLETIETIRKIEFSKIHVFPFSKRDYTVAALMEGQVEETVKKERVKRLLDLSKELELTYMEQQIGKEVEYLKEVWKDGYAIGHTGNYLLVKEKTDCPQVGCLRKGVITAVEYPYVILER